MFLNYTFSYCNDSHNITYDCDIEDSEINKKSRRYTNKPNKYSTTKIKIKINIQLRVEVKIKNKNVAVSV